MADAGRQDFTDKATTALKPDSQMSTAEVAKEKLDSFAATLQPDSTKSISQQAGDKLTGSDKTDERLFDKAKNDVGLGK
uniref:HSP12-like protein n=1 Tax=Thecaphora frezii TaxID=1269715 RepID=A0A8T9MZJ8_9BASI|nr:HSP12-like protein [Thecaphora frezii]